MEARWASRARTRRGTRRPPAARAIPRGSPRAGSRAVGLVHGQGLAAVGCRGADEERVVRRVGEQSEQLQGTALERRRHRRGRQSPLNDRSSRDTRAPPHRSGSRRTGTSDGLARRRQRRVARGRTSVPGWPRAARPQADRPRRARTSSSSASGTDSSISSTNSCRSWS